MSNLQRLSNTAFGIRKYLDKKGFDVGGKGRKPNEILVTFLKDNNLKYVKWNTRYKGLFTAELSNADTVSDNFDLFKKWIQNQFDNRSYTRKTPRKPFTKPIGKPIT